MTHDQQAPEALHAELRAAGLDERPFGRFLLSWTVHALIGFGALTAFVLSSSWLHRAPLLLLSCLGFIGLATLGHTASHYGASRHRLANHVMLYLTYPFLLQLSACFWKRTHVQIHHANPNIVGVDNDCDLRPFFALNDQHQANSGRARRLYYRFQGLHFPFLLLLNTINIQRKGWRFLVGQLRDPAVRKGPILVDLAAMCGHVACWVALPMFWFSPASVMALYLVRSAIIGVGLFCILAPGHFPAEALCLDLSQRAAGDFYLRQTVATVNFETGPLGRFLCSGLEYQIEHHLFPGVSHFPLPALAIRVRAFCARERLPYRSFGWGLVIWKSYRVLFTPKPVHADVEALRVRPEVG